MKYRIDTKLSRNRRTKTIWEFYAFRGYQVPIRRFETLDTEGRWKSSKEEKQRVREALADAKRQARDLPTPSQISALQKKLNLSQRALARLVGGGTHSIQKYVSGTAVPSMAAANLLWLLAMHPGLLAELEKSPKW